jgi:hypothetical protein
MDAAQSCTQWSADSLVPVAVLPATHRLAVLGQVHLADGFEPLCVRVVTLERAPTGQDRQRGRFDLLLELDRSGDPRSDSNQCKLLRYDALPNRRRLARPAAQQARCAIV